MKSVLLFVSVLILNLTSYAQLNKNSPRGHVSQKEFKVDLDILYSAKKKIVVKNVKINGGSKNYRFILDTGAGTYISKELARKLDVEIIKTDSVTDGYSYQKTDYGIVNIELKGIQFSNILVGIDSADLGLGILCDIDGILGNNVIGLCVWEFVGQEITISSNLKISDYNGIYLKQKLKLFSGAPIVMAGILGQYRADMLLDFGDNATMTLQEKDLPYIRNKKTLEGNGDILVTSLKKPIVFSTKVRLLNIPKFTFGNFKRNQSETGLLCSVLTNTENEQFFPIAVIGAGILDYYSIILDIPKKRIYSKRNSTSAEEYFNSFGFSVRPSENTFLVAVVWDNSPAYQKGIKPGYQVLKLNGLDLKRSLKDNRNCKIYSLIENEMGKNDITIVLRRKNGSQVTHTLTKQNLFN